MKLALSLLGVSGLAFAYWAMKHKEKPQPANEYSTVDLTSEESFPASDPPSWTH